MALDTLALVEIISYLVVMFWFTFSLDVCKMAIVQKLFLLQKLNLTNYDLKMRFVLMNLKLVVTEEFSSKKKLNQNALSKVVMLVDMPIYVILMSQF